MIEIITAIIATYGTAALIVSYDGPYDLLFKLRSKVKPFRCVVCTSVWLAIPVSLFSGLTFIEYLAVIGGVILLDWITE